MITRKITILALTLIIAGCSTNTPNILTEKGQPETTDLNYSTEALTKSYLSRKFVKFLNPVNTGLLIKELEYGMQKHPCLTRQAISANEGMLAQIEALDEVRDRRGISPVFDNFVDFLEGPANTITTVAGTGNSGYSGDHDQATNAELYYPYDVVFDSKGNLFISDTYNNVVRKVDHNGIITTIAGGGSPEEGIGDGDKATLASLRNPGGLAFDKSDNLYIGEFDNGRVRKVDTNGIITTVAGGGNNSGEGQQLAVDASLNGPWAIAFDPAGNMYIDDEGASIIKKVDSDGIITNFAGGGESQEDGIQATDAFLGEPWDITFDSAGNLYIADIGQHNNKIRKVDSNGIITTFAGTGEKGYSGDGGPAIEATLDNTWNIVFDSAGNLYAGAASDNKIRKIDTNGIITHYAGIGGDESYSGDDGPAISAGLAYPSGMAFDSFGNLFFADNDNYVIRKIGC
jgi:sugar lactone lactonase YvrE